MRESEMTEKLMDAGADIYLGPGAGQDVEKADLVIYSSAVSSENPELQRAAELGIPAITRAQALGILMDEYDNSIAISGTHGKTTTTSHGLADTEGCRKRGLRYWSAATWRR